MRNVYYVHGDAIRKNKKGAWGFLKILRCKEGFKTESKVEEKEETNKKEMELYATYNAVLDSFKEKVKDVTIYIHSPYVINGIGRDWLSGWAENDWKTTNDKEIKNMKVWQKIYDLIHKKGMRISVVWVKDLKENPFIEYISEKVQEKVEG